MVDLLATSNPSTGQIIGATADSMTLAHEEGHLAYSKIPLYARMSMAEESYKTLALLLVIIYLVVLPYFPTVAFYSKAGFVISICNSFALHLYEEWWCWNYARKKWKQRNTDQVETEKQ